MSFIPPRERGGPLDPRAFDRYVQTVSDGARVKGVAVLFALVLLTLTVVLVASRSFL